jgi:hypothetical protein
MSTKSTQLREFKESLANLAAQLQRDIIASALNLDATSPAIAARRKRVLLGDFEFLAWTYFPHHIRGAPSKFQAHFCHRFPLLLNHPGGVTEWWIAPRGEAKSTLLSKIGPIFVIIRALLQRPEIQAEVGCSAPPRLIDYIIQLGAEFSLPAKLVEVVKIELTSNAALQLDFPEICGRGSLWRIGEAVSKNNVKFEARGADQAIRGTFHGASRPSLILPDDMITDAEAKSEKSRDARWDFLEKSIAFLGPPDGSVKTIGVGTVLHKDDPLSRAKRTMGHIVHHFRALERMPIREDLWEICVGIMLNQDGRAQKQASDEGYVIAETALPSYQYYLANKAEMDRGAVVSWPEVRSLYTIMAKRASNKKAFNTELQGDGRDDEDKVFNHITYWAQKSRDWVIFATCDPSMGQGQNSDPSGIMAGGLDRSTKVLHIMEAVAKRRAPSKIESDIIDLHTRLRCRAIGFESNGGYDWARQNLIVHARHKGVALPLVGITSTLPRDVRIEAIEPFITDRRAPGILFNAELKQLLDQLDSWPEPMSSHHYDLLCCLEMLHTLALKHGGIGTSGARSSGKRQSAPANLADYQKM